MQTIEYRHVDKSNWGDGPWQNEPDKKQWRDPNTGLPCLAVRNHVGAWCGYVGVPVTHPEYAQHYDNLSYIEVHGGLTFASKCIEEGSIESRICHVPDEAETDDIWWFGFDCCHSMDYAPDLGLRFKSIAGGDTYRTLEYVEEQVTKLAKQLQGVQLEVTNGNSNI